MPRMSTYRLKIKEIAIAKGFNQSSLSRASDVSFTTIRRIWRNEQYDIGMNTLSKIARALGVSITDLVSED